MDVPHLAVCTIIRQVGRFVVSYLHTKVECNKTKSGDKFFIVYYFKECRLLVTWGDTITIIESAQIILIEEGRAAGGVAMAQPITQVAFHVTRFTTSP